MVEYKALMAEIKIEVPDTAPCPQCERQVTIGLTSCPTCEKELPVRIHAGQLLIAFTTGEVLDARRGGLVMGRHEPADDIPIVRAVVPGILEVCGRMHGGEFIVNARASRENATRLEEINAYRSPEYTPISNIALTDTTRIFNTNGTEGPESHLWLLVQSGQFIVNRAGTIEYFEELERINNSVAPVLG
jgi:hypothetical protein